MLQADQDCNGSKLIFETPGSLNRETISAAAWVIGLKLRLGSELSKWHRDCFESELGRSSMPVLTEEKSNQQSRKFSVEASVATSTIFDYKLAKVRSARLRVALQSLLRQEPAKKEAILRAIEAIGESETIERALLDRLQSTADLGDVQSLTDAIQEFGKGRNWLTRFEDYAGSLGEDTQLQAPTEFERMIAALEVGAVSGAYRFGKGFVVGVGELVRIVYRVIFTTEAKKKIWELYKKYLIWVVKLNFGTMEMRVEAAKQLASLAEQITQQVYASFTQEWDRAVDEGREVEVVSRWITQGALEVATLGIGAAKGPAAAEKLAETARATRLATESALVKIESEVGEAREMYRRYKTAKEINSPKYIAEYAEKSEALAFMGLRSQKAFGSASKNVQSFILKNLQEFLPSLAKRGAGSLEGRYARFMPFVGPRMDQAVARMISVAKKIERGEAIDVYCLIKKGPKPSSAEYLEEALRESLKGKGFKGHQRKIGGNYRLGEGRYVGVETYDHLAFEVNPATGGVGADYTLLKAKFKPPGGLRYSFKLFPSVRRPGGGVNLVDTMLSKRGVFTQVEEVLNPSFSRSVP